MYTGYYQEEFIDYGKNQWFAHKLDLLLLASTFDLGDVNVILPDLDEIENCYDESVDYKSDDIIEIGSYFLILYQIRFHIMVGMYILVRIGLIILIIPVIALLPIIMMKFYPY